MTGQYADLRIEVADEHAMALEWDRLAQASGNVFATREWTAAWSEHLGDGTPVLLGARDGTGSLRAIVPLVRRRERGARTLRLLGHGPADELGPVCAPEDRIAVARALREWLSSARGWDIVVADALPGGWRWDAALGGVVTAAESSPVLELPDGDWDAFLAGRSRNLREQIRRRERKLRREHEVSLHLTSSAATLADDLDTLIRLHHARFSAGESAAFAGPRAAFHHDFARRALDRGWLRLWTLQVDGAPAAAWYGLRFGDADVFYQSGRDPRLERESVGFVLLTHTIRDAVEAGRREYRFGLGDESYKGRFATADLGLQQVTATGSALGRSLVLARSARRRLRQMARRSESR